MTKPKLVPKRNRRKLCLFVVVVGGSYDVYMYKQLCLLHCMIKKESKTKNKTKTSNE